MAEAVFTGTGHNMGSEGEEFSKTVLVLMNGSSVGEVAFTKLLTSFRISHKARCRVT